MVGRKIVFADAIHDDDLVFMEEDEQGRVLVRRIEPWTTPPDDVKLFRFQLAGDGKGQLRGIDRGPRPHFRRYRNNTEPR